MFWGNDKSVKIRIVDVTMSPSAKTFVESLLLLVVSPMFDVLGLCIRFSMTMSSTHPVS